MRRMTKKNLENIKAIFEEKTGTELNPDSRRACPLVRKIAVLAAVLVCCFAMAAFGWPLFSPLRGDALTLSATYEGGGIVSVYVENGSDRDLEFQRQTKLMCWATGTEVERLEGEILFENTAFPAHSSGTMMVDFSGAYDIAELEGDGRNFGQYYLLLTNHDFLFGHDWMCSFSFADKEREMAYETLPHVTAEAEGLAQIEGELRFYFEDAYHDEVMAWNDANFTYLQKVDEVIKRFDGNVVPPLYPTIMVTGPSTFLDPQPLVDTASGFGQVDGECAVGSDWTPVDGYNRLIGASVLEKALTVSALLPQKEGDGCGAVPLVYTLVYEAAAAQKREDFVFFYGRFRSFAEMEPCKVYEDEHYVVYDVTDALYTDLDAYLDYVQTTREDLLLDTQARAHIRDVYAYFRENIGDLIY